MSVAICEYWEDRETHTMFTQSISYSHGTQSYDGHLSNYNKILERCIELFEEKHGYIEGKYFII